MLISLHASPHGMLNYGELVFETVAKTMLFIWEIADSKFR